MFSVRRKLHPKETARHKMCWYLFLYRVKQVNDDNKVPYAKCEVNFWNPIIWVFCVICLCADLYRGIIEALSAFKDSLKLDEIVYFEEKDFKII